MVVSSKDGRVVREVPGCASWRLALSCAGDVGGWV